MADWGEQFADMAAGIGAGAANYELARRAPQAYIGMQKGAMLLFVLMIVLFIVIAVIGFRQKS